MSLKYYSEWKPIQAHVGVNADGYAGPLTRAAVAKAIGSNDNWYSIQCTVGTSVDGIPGPNTIKAISIALGLEDKHIDAGRLHVAIDIGHAHKTGSTGNGLEEHAVNVIVCDHLKEMLRNNGYAVTVVDFPDKNNSEDLNSTISYLNSIDYSCAISLHSDWAANEEAKGGHTIIAKGDTVSKDLAHCISKGLVQLLPGRAAAIEERTDLGILNRTKKKPVVLCEGGFITNVHDSTIMRDHPELIAKAYCDGISDYFIIKG